jgi:hypothetical protein
VKNILILILFLLLLPVTAMATEADVYCLTGTTSTGAPNWQPASTTNPCPMGGSGGGGAVIVIQPPMTYQGTMALTANTSTAMTSANVTMTFGVLPSPGAFGYLTIISPGSSCNFTVNWDGGSATAVSGEQFGPGTMVGSDKENLTGLSNAPTLFSTSGCVSPNLIQFHN